MGGGGGEVVPGGLWGEEGEVVPGGLCGGVDCAR